MMTDLHKLYQAVIIDHGRRPHNFGPLPGASHQAEGFNPLCGDRLTVRLKLVDGIIEEARFEGTGCAISTASASLMTEALKGCTKAEADSLFACFHAMLTSERQPGAATLGKLEVFAGVREFPMRIKCATLAWHTLRAALHQDGRAVTTE